MSGEGPVVIMTDLQQSICRRTRYGKVYTTKDLARRLGTTPQGIHNAMRGLMQLALRGTYNYRWERVGGGYEKVAYWTVWRVG